MPHQDQTPAAGDGAEGDYHLLPGVPTPKMLAAAGRTGVGMFTAGECYRAMIAAAPAAPARDAGPDQGGGDLLARFRDFVVINATAWKRGANHHHPIWQEVADAVAGASAPGPAADVAGLGEIPPEGSEERDFWIEAAIQHGFEPVDDGDYTRGEDDRHIATSRSILKLMSEARKQGQRDVLATRVPLGIEGLSIRNPAPDASPPQSPGPGYRVLPAHEITGHGRFTPVTLGSGTKASTPPIGGAPARADGPDREAVLALLREVTRCLDGIGAVAVPTIRLIREGTRPDGGRADFLQEVADRVRRFLAFSTPTGQARTAGAGGERVRIDYTNYRSERGIRTITVWGAEWGSTEFHPEPQWLVTGYDHGKHACRVFALRDIHAWNGVPTQNPAALAATASGAVGGREEQGAPSGTGSRERGPAVPASGFDPSRTSGDL